MTIGELKDKIHLVTNGVDNPTAKLQDICSDILLSFHVESDGWKLWPTEVEAYCNCSSYPDVYVHRNKLQNDRFGKLYVHRHPDNHTADGKPKGWAGMDICLSDEKTFHFGMLIRSAYVNSLDKEPVIGPYKLYRTINKGDGYYLTLENDVALVSNKKTLSDPVFFSKRVGLKHKDEDKDDLFLNEKLRAVRADSLKKYGYRWKEELFKSCPVPSGMSYEEFAKYMLGYVPSLK